MKPNHSQPSELQARRTTRSPLQHRWIQLALIGNVLFFGCLFVLSPSAHAQARGAYGKRHSSLYYHERLESLAEQSHDGRRSHELDIDPTEIRASDEIWFVNTHEMPEFATDEHRFIVNVFGHGSKRSSSVLQLIETINDRDDRLNVVFIHGNRTDLEWAENRGWLVYQRVIAQCPDDVPVRFVIWAWPSQKQYTALRDFREKAERADAEGCHLGWFLQRLHPECSLGMIGYSYGARVVLGGIQLVASQGFLRKQTDAPAFLGSRHTRRMLDGSVIEPLRESLSKSEQLVATLPIPRRINPQDNQPSDQEPPAKWGLPRYRVALVAAAFDRDWLLPGGRLGQSYNLLQELLLINNSSDRAMRFYGIVDRGGFPKALGFRGVPSLHCLSDFGEKIQQLDVSAEVGRKHSIERYFGSESVIARVHAIIMPHSSDGHHSYAAEQLLPLAEDTSSLN